MLNAKSIPEFQQSGKIIPLIEINKKKRQRSTFTGCMAKEKCRYSGNMPI
jgi:hypothetical protein